MQPCWRKHGAAPPPPPCGWKCDGRFRCLPPCLPLCAALVRVFYRSDGKVTTTQAGPLPLSHSPAVALSFLFPLLSGFCLILPRVLLPGPHWGKMWTCGAMLSQLGGSTVRVGRRGWWVAQTLYKGKAGPHHREQASSKCLSPLGW